MTEAKISPADRALASEAGGTSDTVANQNESNPSGVQIRARQLSTEWGQFIEPDPALCDAEDLVQALGLRVFSGHRSVFSMRSYRGQNLLFDKILRQIEALDISYEDQCSGNYYFDLFQVLQALQGKIQRVAEVGVFMGGASVIFAGCAEAFDYGVDLIDIEPRFLRFAYERIRRTHPGAEKTVRLFYGGLPEYTARVLTETKEKTLVHHDGAHDFNQVVRDLSSLYFAKDAVHALVCQDTHLRGKVEKFNFVDMALYGVFGTNLVYTPIGTYYSADDELMTTPNQYQGNYFLPDTPEGMVLLMEENTFRYPHPSMQLAEFLGAQPT